MAPALAPNAHWHPAFRPNAAVDIIAAPVLAPSSLPASETAVDGEPSPQLQRDGGEALHAREEDTSVGNAESIDAAQDQLDGNSIHPELDNLRTALSTSLSSPGGVEMDESPVHHDSPSPDTPTDKKAQFPSEGPANGTSNKHSSSDSFARTVSEQVNWGEDDEVDPEWNLHRSDTDPFKHMAKSDRTNSFPQVPAAHNPQLECSPISHGQVEDIMNEVEQTHHDMFSDGRLGDDTDFFAQPDDPIGNTSSLVAGQSEQLIASDYGQTYGGDLQQDEDEDSRARFEEGVPLMGTSIAHPDASKPETSREVNEPDNIKEEDQDLIVKASRPAEDEQEEDDFFAQVSKQSVAEREDPKPPALERKSTVQVMNSLHFQPHEHNHEDASGDAKRKDSFARATGGGIAASISTIASEVLGSPEAIMDEERDPCETDEATADLEAIPSEDDLAAKWQAALAEDDFLDDEDELLADDDEADTKPIDPADLFGSDEEGFLEDNDDQPQTTQLLFQESSPPAPNAVRSSNGHFIGFDSLSRNVTESHVRLDSSSSNRYLPAGQSKASAAAASPYSPATPLFTDLSNPAPPHPAPYGATPAAINYGSQPTQQPQRPDLQKAQSFANQAKGGYSSPYDLPMEVVPRKRVSMGQMARSYTSAPSATNAAPPRSSSYNSQLLQQRGATASMSPPTSSQSHQPSQLQPSPLLPPLSRQGAPAQNSRPIANNGFFEDLPVVSRPKPATRHTSAPGVSPTFPPTNQAPPPPAGPARNMSYAPLPSKQLPQHLPVQNQGMVAPERVNPYAAMPSGLAAETTINANNRYSPAPSSHSAPPSITPNQYAPVPSQTQNRPPVPGYAQPSAQQQSPASQLHLPRTSSPLAHFVEKSQDQRSYHSIGEAPILDRRISSSSYGMHSLPSTREVDENENVSSPAAVYDESSRQHAPSYASQSLGRPPPRSMTQSPPSQSSGARPTGPSKNVASNYTPEHYGGAQPSSSIVSPPQRSQTQSPGALMGGHRFGMSASDNYQRPASVEPASPNANPQVYSPLSLPPTTGRPRGFSQGLNYVLPVDGSQEDPLQRWKGGPVFAWGVGGTIITSFPKDVPRYGLHSTSPMIIRSPGEVKIRNIKDVDPINARITSFPGPLKGKAKKKEVITWLSSGIEILEQNAVYLSSLPALSHDDKRTEERLLLWKILRVFVENDGLLEGNPVVDKAVRVVLSPSLDDADSQASSYATGAELSGISHSAESMTRTEPVDPAAVEQLRKFLLRGEREKAVWEAVDKRLWAHAMLIANTLSKDIYKQVAQEFVQKEVKNIGANTESLAVLYEIFAGNFEESIDELVPPSARAGFQMVSTSNAMGASKDALDGLDRWRETLGLVLSNRSVEDSKALTALGKLLSGYGRAEAAHICFLFARTHAVFGGIDDASSNIVLVGSDHLRQPYDFDRELEPVLLSEVYEYGLSLSATSSTAASSPHLAIYKLHHAMVLTEYGYREKALQYCETVATSITSQTRRSPYHHALLVSSLDDLSKRLKASPRDDKTSWISKPSIDKVSSSVWDTFNKFVAGDEKDAKPGSSSGPAEDLGPFARVAGSTPGISRTPSVANIYGSYNGGLDIKGLPAQTSVAASRYGPAGAYTPPSTSYEQQINSPYGSQPRSSMEGARSSGEYNRRSMDRQNSDYRPTSQVSNHPQSQYASSYQSQSYMPHDGNGSPYPSNASPYEPRAATPASESAPMYGSPQQFNSYDGGAQPRASLESSASLYTSQQTSNGGYQPSSEAYEPPSGGYEPPTSGYVPYEPEPDSPVDTKPKKSFMDEDDDGMSTSKPADTNRAMTKAEKDRETDEAFRKAAEADAQKQASAPKAKGWGLPLTGWFGGKKEATPEMTSPNKPIKAKLGEKSSFVYDPEQKRWINKQAGADNAPKPSSAAPPPKAGPSRPPSIGPQGAPPAMSRSFSSASAPPQRSFSGTSDISGSALPHAESAGSLAAPPAMSRTASSSSFAGPPSRPGTGMSGASDIDDLLGPAMGGPRKGPRVKAAKGAKKSRYVDVMGDK